MTRAATFIIIVTLTGMPLANIACAALCHRPSMAGTIGGCHEHAPTSTDTAIVPFHSCDETVFTTAFLPEPTHPLVTAATVVLTVAPESRTFELHLRSVGLPVRSAANSPPATHALSAVLRI